MSDTTIPIGGMVPLTGTAASDGREFSNGITLACEEINRRGGILGRHLAPILVDTGNQTAAETVRAARQLISKGVHAIFAGYNIGAQNSEYEPVADAGIIYIHHNTLLQHHDTVMSDPDRYFGCFMADPAEYWYGQGFIKFLSWLRGCGQWQPASNRIAIVSGPKPYSIVIAYAMMQAAEEFGWSPVFRPRILRRLPADWRPLLDEIRAADPAVLAMTHFHSGDLARFHLQFMSDPLPALLYLQYGALHRTFFELVGEKARGTIVGTVVGLLRDDMGWSFFKRYKARFGASATPEIGCQTYNALHHYAIAAAVAGGTAGGAGAHEQNRRIADILLSLPYRGVSGTIRYHPQWQAAMPYPDLTRDPSMGLPHLFYQLRGPDDPPALIAPEPFCDSSFKLPPWFHTN